MSQEIDAFLLANGAAQSERIRRQGPGIVRPAAFRFVFIARARVESSLPLGFLSDNGACKLTLTLAEVVQDDEVNGLTAARMTVAVEVGKVAHFDTAEGKSLEFKCQAGAQVMIVNVLNRVAY